MITQALCFALLLVPQTVTSINQTGGITAVSVGSVIDGQIATPWIIKVSGPSHDVRCLARRGYYRLNRYGLYDRTPRFKAMSMTQRRQAMRVCMRRSVP